MEFGDTLVQFNIFKAMKHPIEDSSLFGIDLVDELVEENLQLNTSNDDTLDFAGDTDIFDCLRSVTIEADCNKLREVRDLSNPEDVCNHEDPKYSYNVGVHVAKIEKQLSAQVATMFIAEYMPRPNKKEQMQQCQLPSTWT
ncbi:hypothetical protein CR513_10928, partial [Mucuna pruriens]